MIFKKLSLSKKRNKHSNQDVHVSKLLIVDDEESVHQVTRLALKYFDSKEVRLEIISAYSAQEAISKMQEHPDIAVILMDVVMETNNAGLEAIEYIREELRNTHVRIILRTGQAGMAPERKVIERYDINDYKEKTELTQDKLYTAIRMGLKSYGYITSMQRQINSLEYITQAASTLFGIDSLENILRSIFSTAVDLIGVSEGNEAVEYIGGIVAYPVMQSGECKICYAIDAGHDDRDDKAVIAEVVQQLHRHLPTMRGAFATKNGSFVIPIMDKHEVLAIILLNNLRDISNQGQHLLNILAMQSSIAFKNIDIYEILLREHTETVNLLAIASEYKDEDTGDHVRRVEYIALLIAKELGMGNQGAEEISQASILHDIGKLSVPDSILKKPGKLTKEEFGVIQMHTTIGGKILSSHSQFELASEIALTHHESYDGTGYPLGLKGVEIPVSGRIVALVDVYDALINKRPYKVAWPQLKALDLIREERGKKFDPQIVDAFMRVVDKGLL
ncbi:MAG: HD domain-containing protein [Gammaproteobacteria bacterium]|nr:HD domain-containing protein [Gammaproteobacteria bacterium]